MYDDEFDETTVFTEISETENAINHATSAVPSYTHSSSIGSTTMSKVNSTVAMSSTESSSSSSFPSSTEHTGKYYKFDLQIIKREKKKRMKEFKVYVREHIFKS